MSPGVLGSPPRRTVPGGTLTADGFIPHLRVSGVDLPVRLATNAGLIGRGGLCPPVRLGDRLVFALPGNDVYLGPRT